ncbi:FAD binding domain-containing protein [Rhodovibrionaceae bacterium A322]
MRYIAPDQLDDALGVLASGPCRLLAGGTDFYPLLGEDPVFSDHRTDPVMDLSGLAGLRGIARDEVDGRPVWRLGALTTWSDVVKADLPPVFDGLKAAGREVGSLQIQNVGTVAGNLCNASPAADGVPPLLTLEASVELSSRQGKRVLPLAEFITGVRQTARRPEELVTAILVPDQTADSCSAFLKLGARRYLVISIAMVAAVLVPDGAGKVASARVAVGSCSAVAQRLPDLEAALCGQSWSAEALQACVTADHLSLLSPIDDVRGSADYRRDAARELVGRAVALCVEGEGA